MYDKWCFARISEYDDSLAGGWEFCTLQSSEGQQAYISQLRKDEVNTWVAAQAAKLYDSFQTPGEGEGATIGLL